MWQCVVAVTVVLVPGVISQYQPLIPDKWHANQYPGDPWWFHEDCNRDNKSAICDPNRLISKEDANEIDRLIEAVAVGTRCPCYHCVSNQRGYVIRVALMEEMEPLIKEPDDIMDGLKNARLFAYMLTQRWKLTGNCNETLLIVYSRRDRVLYTMTGKQTQQRLTDDLIVEITVDVGPYFDSRETIAEGLKEMIKRYRSVLTGKYNRKEAMNGGYPIDNGGGRGGAMMIMWSPALLFVLVPALFIC